MMLEPILLPPNPDPLPQINFPDRVVVLWQEFLFPPASFDGSGIERLVNGAF